MTNYKSWSGLKKRLEDRLCEELRGRISYFLTRYHKVNDSYGRAAVRLDGEELVCFSWNMMYEQDRQLNETWRESGEWDRESFRDKWNAEGTFCEMDFLGAALVFLEMPIDEALTDGDYLIRMFAIMDGRVGKRTLQQIAEKGEYLSYPAWLRQFYELRLEI